MVLHKATAAGGHGACLVLHKATAAGGHGACPAMKPLPKKCISKGGPPPKVTRKRAGQDQSCFDFATESLLCPKVLVLLVLLTSKMIQAQSPFSKGMFGSRP